MPWIYPALIESSKGTKILTSIKMKSIKPATAPIKERLLALTQELTTQGLACITVNDAARMISATRTGLTKLLGKMVYDGELAVYKSVIQFDKNGSTRCEGLAAVATVIRRDNVEVARFVGLQSDTYAFRYMHKAHSFSIDHAIQHEGYTIETINEYGSAFWN